MTTETARLRLKTWICAVIVVFSNVFGNFFLKRGMPAELSTPLEYITVLFRPWVAAGVALSHAGACQAGLEPATLCLKGKCSTD